MFVVPFFFFFFWGGGGVKKRIWCVLGSQPHEIPQQEPSRYPSRVLGGPKKFSVTELLPFKDKKKFPSPPQNRILVPTRGSFRNFRPVSTPSFSNAPPPRPRGTVKLGEPALGRNDRLHYQTLTRIVGEFYVQWALKRFLRYFVYI